jgi:hypothetical protein
VAAEVDERELVGFQPVRGRQGFQVVPAVAAGDCVFGAGFLAILRNSRYVSSVTY